MNLEFRITVSYQVNIVAGNGWRDFSYQLVLDRFGLTSPRSNVLLEL